MRFHFVIPSKGRPTLANTISSLYNVEKWDQRGANACVGFDNVEPTISCQKWNSVYPVVTPTKLGEGINSAGKVRNYIVDNLKDCFPKDDWVGFVDDDDIVDHKYLMFVYRILQDNHWDIDLIIFRMQYQDGTILPPPDFKYPENCNAATLENKVGISFACSIELFKKLGGFVPSGGEDADFIKRAEAAGARIHLSDEVAYYVCPLGVPPDRRK
jgi:hypothetical protein